MGKKRKLHQSKAKDNTIKMDDAPNRNSYNYFHDEIDAFHDKQEKILLEKGPLDGESSFSDSEEEVLPLESSDYTDEEEDERISTYKDQIRHLQQKNRKYRSQDDIADSQTTTDEGWGQKKSHYYGADIRDDDDIEIEEGEGEAQGGRALEEEKEALALQKRLTQELDEEDFAIGDFLQLPDSNDMEVQKSDTVVKDLSKLSQSEKVKLFMKESPEFDTLKSEFIEKMSLVTSLLQPVWGMIRFGQLARSDIGCYVKTRLNLYMNYCLNISFYMALKAHQTPVRPHPVIQRILRYYSLIEKLDKLDRIYGSRLKRILERKDQGLSIIDVDVTSQSHNSKTKVQSPPKKVKSAKNNPKVKSVSNLEHLPVIHHMQTSGEREASMYYRQAQGLNETTDDSDDYADLRVSDEPVPTEKGHQVDSSVKRAITYEMAKNKGLTAKKKKINRNPRVKHRVKYKKALVKRKSLIREAKPALVPYAGEITGIRAGLKQGVKLN